MALVQCPECSVQVSNHALACPSCGCPITKMRDLRSAILRKDLKQVSELIYFGADVNKVGKNGWTPLMLATAKGSAKIVEMLLTAGADPAFFNAQGESALTIAISKRRRTIEQLLKRALFAETAAALELEAEAKDAEILSRIEPPVESPAKEPATEPVNEVAASDFDQPFGEATLPFNFQPPEDFANVMNHPLEQPPQYLAESESGFITSGMDDEPERITFREVEERPDLNVQDTDQVLEQLAVESHVEFGDTTVVMSSEVAELPEADEMASTAEESAPELQQYEEPNPDIGEATAVMSRSEEVDFAETPDVQSEDFGDSTVVMELQNEAAQPEEIYESDAAPSINDTQPILISMADLEERHEEEMQDPGDVTAVMEIGDEEQRAFEALAEEHASENHALLFIGNEDFDNNTEEPDQIAEIGDATAVMKLENQNDEIEEKGEPEVIHPLMFVGNQSLEENEIELLNDNTQEAEQLESFVVEESLVSIEEPEQPEESAEDYGEDTVILYTPKWSEEPEPELLQENEDATEPEFYFADSRTEKEDQVEELSLEEVVSEAAENTEEGFEEPTVRELIAEWTKEAEAMELNAQQDLHEKEIANVHEEEIASLSEEVIQEDRVEQDFVWFDGDDELEAELLSCPECNHAVGPNDVICSNCKAWISGHFCPHCSNLITDDAEICSMCGNDTVEKSVEPSGFHTKFMAGAAAALFVLLIVFFVNAQKSSHSENTAAEQNSLPSATTPVPPKAEPQLETDTEEPAEIPHISKGKEPSVSQALPSKASELRRKQSEKSSTARQETSKTSRNSNPMQAQVSSKPPVETKSEPKEARIERPSVSEPKKASSVARNSSRTPLPNDKLTEQQRIRKGRYLNGVGFSLIKRGEAAEAVQVLERAVEAFPPDTKDPHYAYALFNLAVAWRKVGRPDRAIPILEERLKINNQRDVVERELLTAKRQAGRIK